MYTAVIRPCQLAGTVRVPPSKSMAHRTLIAASLTDRGSSVIRNLGDSQDIRATRRCLTALGARIEGLEPGAVRVSQGLGTAIVEAGPAPILDCGESGSTLRFLIPLALLVGGQAAFTGRGRLMERPLKPYEDLFRERGIAWELKDGVLTVNGGRGHDRLALDPGEYRLPGDVSSQFITGLLFALPLLEGDSQLVLTTPLESAAYVDLTLEVLARFGVRIGRARDRFTVPGGQRYRPCDVELPGDWSQGSIWYAANFLDHQVKLEGLDETSAQADRAVAAYYWKLARPGDRELDVSQCPDLAPALGAMAALARGTTRLAGAGRLRLKESDRLSAIAQTINALGGSAREGEDSLTIEGVRELAGGCEIDPRGDHRMAMMAAILATRCRAPVSIQDMECVDKSYPGFWRDFTSLGGKLDVL